MRHPIAQFTYFGASYDYRGDGYAIDDNLKVYKHGKMLRSKGPNLMRVGLYHRVLTAFGVARLWLAVTKPLPVEIESCSGIRVIDRSLSETNAHRYNWETPTDRYELCRVRQTRLDAIEVDLWKPVRYDGNIYEKYEISCKSGVIRNAKTKATITESGGTHASRYSISTGKMRKKICSYRAYMCTYESENRLPHQQEVDHINGDHMDNSPCNLRWASASENAMYKFKANARMEKGVLFTGDLSDLKRFRDSNYYFGVVDGDFAVVDRKRMRRVNNFRTTRRGLYPTFGIDGHRYLAHRVVALVEGILSEEQFENSRGGEVVVMHLDDDKTNFRPENLRIGTRSENSLCTHANPLTTGKKRVRQLDDDGICVAEFESITAAAKAVGVTDDGIRRSITKKRHHKGHRFELVII